MRLTVLTKQLHEPRAPRKYLPAECAGHASGVTQEHVAMQRDQFFLSSETGTTICYETPSSIVQSN
jgi:hypothetical protein